MLNASERRTVFPGSDSPGRDEAGKARSGAGWGIFGAGLFSFDPGVPEFLFPADDPSGLPGDDRVILERDGVPYISGASPGRLSPRFDLDGRFARLVASVVCKGKNP